MHPIVGSSGIHFSKSHPGQQTTAHTLINDQRWPWVNCRGLNHVSQFPQNPNQDGSTDARTLGPPGTALRLLFISPLQDPGVMCIFLVVLQLFLHASQNVRILRGIGYVLRLFGVFA